MPESKENIARVTRDEARRLKGETDYARIDALTDADIAKGVADDPDAPPIDIDWAQARLTLPPGKDMVTLRLDRDVLDWLRAQGKGYQTLINQVLRAWYDAQQTRNRDEAPGWRALKAHRKTSQPKSSATVAEKATAKKRKVAAKKAKRPAPAKRRA